MGLIEYVPAMTTFDYLIIAIDDEFAAEAARYIHKACKTVCGILTYVNTSTNTILNNAIRQHRCIIYLHKGMQPLTIESLELISHKSGIIHIHIFSLNDAMKIVETIMSCMP